MSQSELEKQIKEATSELELLAGKLKEAEKEYDAALYSNLSLNERGAKGEARAQVRFNEAEREKNKAEHAFEQQRFKVDRLKKELLAESNE